MATRRFHRRRTIRSPAALLVLGALVGGSIASQFSSGEAVTETPQNLPGLPFNRTKPDCNIKGNISIKSRERIYHVPGQRYYAETVIRPEYGERWFCSEQEAVSAGWRKSKI